MKMLYAVKYTGDPEVYLVRAECPEEAEDTWLESQMEIHPQNTYMSFHIDVRSVPAVKKVVPVGKLFE